ncbi:MAG: dihydroorotate dehydrogenase-like protein, partial [Acidimicrobiia bacterium]|nr:dihydroorotate dehydrogenase-like protein [Acidimicrobiia bacterium]
LFGRLHTQFAATSGVHTAEDVVKLLLAGADVTMTTAALLKYGPGHLTELVCDLERWLDDNDYSSVSQLRGSLSQTNAPDPAAFERHNYMKALTTFRSPTVA